MLSLDDALRVRDLFRELGSLAAVSRETGFDVKTIKRALSRDYSVPVRRSRSSLIDALRPLNTSERVPFIQRFLSGDRLSDILAAVEAQRAPLFKYSSLLNGDDDGTQPRITAALLATKIRNGDQ